MQPIAVPSGAEVKHGALMDHLHSGALQRQQDLVMAVLALAERPLSRHDIAERGGMALSSACARVGALLDRDLVEVAGTVKPAGVRSARSTLRLTAQGWVDAEQILEEVRRGET
ncbi:MAG: hypothetical protein ACQEUG_15915 [Pseudomonadota bacterium]